MSLGLAVSLLDGPDATREGAQAWLRGLTGADELALDPPPRSGCPREHRVDVATAGGVRELRFRLPTGADQEAVAAQTLTDPTSGGASLLDRCLIAKPGSASGPDDEIAVGDAIAAL